jgi:hypothetical protein
LRAKDVVSFSLIALLYCAIGVAVYWFFFRSSPVAYVEPSPPPPGWERLAACGLMQSLNGRNQLELLENKTAVLWDLSTIIKGEGKTKKPIEAVWSYDKSSKQYVITIDGQSVMYKFLSLDYPSICMLFKGDITAVDLNAAWLSTRDNDADEDNAEAMDYRGPSPPNP